MKHKKFNLEAIKAVPILRAAEKMNVQLVRTAAGEWSVKDESDPRGHNSITVFERTNSFVRWSGKDQGGCNKGSVIDFVRHMQDDSDFREACTFLSKI